jgi:hypothetical protein
MALAALMTRMIKIWLAKIVGIVNREHPIFDMVAISRRLSRIDSTITSELVSNVTHDTTVVTAVR